MTSPDTQGVTELASAANQRPGVAACTNERARLGVGVRVKVMGLIGPFNQSKGMSVMRKPGL